MSAYPCPFCGDTFAMYDTFTCDECGTRLCVHCAQTIDSEDAVCPPCFHEAMMADDEEEEPA